MKTFGIVGAAGYIAQRHKEAIKRIGGKIVIEYDPFLSNLQYARDIFKWNFDYLVICSPSNTHYSYIKMGLDYGRKIICEKPAFLPWQPIIDNNDINIVLQYNWLKIENPNEIDMIEVIMNRDIDYFKSWKGNSMLTGGIFFNLFIHYIFLALKFNRPFMGKIVQGEKQYRRIGKIDLNLVDIDCLYEKMYFDIIFNDKGIKPKDIFYLMWFLNRCNMKFGMAKNCLYNPIYIDPSCEI